MREFLPFNKNEPFHSFLFEQYGKPSQEIVEKLLAESFHVDDVTDYIYLELFRALEKKEYIKANYDNHEQYPWIATDKTQMFDDAIERAGVVNVIRPDYRSNEFDSNELVADTIPDLTYRAHCISFIYTAGEYIGQQIDQQKGFEDSLYEAVLVPPLFDESFFSRDR